MLVESPAGVWVVRPDGSRRLLGRYEEATWSPHGLFVAVTNRDGLLAVTPAGGVRWALSRRGAESPRWAPSGFRIAYRVDGALRVVAGDGTGDRPLGRDLGTTAPAWSPTIKGNVLAASDRRGRIVVLDADTGTRWGRSRPGAHPLSLTWSADGQVLLAVTPRSLRIFDPGGREIARRPLPRRAIAGAAAFAPRGYTFALVRRLPRADGDEVVLMRGDPPGTPASPADTTGNAGGTASGRLVFRGAGRLGELAWSPDGRWLAIAWPTADQWLFVRPGSRPRVRAAGDIARQFDPAASGPAAAPAIAGWCCPF
jgi:dipeptidyl aminopeptidase/acylaminoacyl peptidase